MFRLCKLVQLLAPLIGVWAAQAAVRLRGPVARWGARLRALPHTGHMGTTTFSIETKIYVLKDLKKGGERGKKRRRVRGTSTTSSSSGAAVPPEAKDTWAGEGRWKTDQNITGFIVICSMLDSKQTGFSLTLYMNINCIFVGFKFFFPFCFKSLWV